MTKPVCAVVGVGEGNGAALARSFADAGMAVALLARSTGFTSKLAAELPDARAYACDAADPASVADAFASIRQELGDPATLVYNAGSGIWGDVESISLDAFESSWRINAYGALVASQQVIPAMKAAGTGTIIFIGATASRRGGPRTAAFAPAKAAQPRRIDGAEPLATRHPRGADHHRCRGRSPKNASGHARQAGELLPEAGRHGGNRRVACTAATLGLDLRGRGEAVRRELVRFAFDGLEVSLEGGQVGSSDLFIKATGRLSD